MTSSTDMLVSSQFSSWDNVKDQFICLTVLLGVIFGSPVHVHSLHYSHWMEQH